MKILFLTQYFPPEVGAPQNRLFELAVRLKRLGVDVEVLTAMPNYPKMEIQEEYKGKWYLKEDLEGLTVYRSWIYVSKKKSIISRLLNYFSFVFSSMWVGIFKVDRPDYIFCESPPLFLGYSARVLRRFKKAGMIFNVSDLWPESAEKLGLITNKTLLGMAKRLEEKCYRKSDFITGQTKGIVKDIQTRFPQKHVYWLPNGVDMGFYDPDKLKDKTWKFDNHFKEDDFLFLYAGIIGYAQGLDVILKAAELVKDNTRIKFILLGSGPEKERLLSLKDSMKLENVFFYDAVSKKEMPSIVASIDVALIPLKKLDLFKGAIPSKIFENLAMKKPILLGVEGEANELFIQEGKAGLAFEPENELDLSRKVLQFFSGKEQLKDFGENGYQYVEKNFTRDKLARDFFDILNNEYAAKNR